MQLRCPRTTFTIAGFGLGLVLFGIFWKFTGWPWLWAWWLGISCPTFLEYAYDKAQAGVMGRQRVPECVLHLLALAGGVLGAWIGRTVLRHKTRRGSFNFVLVFATALHAGLWYYLVRRHAGPAW